jgi:hypothetical protein
MSIASDLIEERTVTQIIYDANKSSSLLLSGTKIIIQELIVNQNEIKIDVQGITYNTITTPWNNITNGPDLIKSLSQPTNSSTLNVNNTLQIQNESDSPTKTIVISSDISGNRIAIDGDYGSANQMLKSGGTEDSVYWGAGETLSDILTNGHTANKNIDMNSYSIENISSVSINTTPIRVSPLTLTGMAFPITIDGTIYYLPLYVNS